MRIRGHDGAISSGRFTPFREGNTHIRGMMVLISCLFCYH